MVWDAAPRHPRPGLSRRHRDEHVRVRRRRHPGLRGGYEDWLRQRPADPVVPARRSQGARTSPRSPQRSAAATATAPKKPSYQERRELEALPGRIDALEAEQRALGDRIAHQDFYKESVAAIAEALERVQQLERDIADLYAL